MRLSTAIKETIVKNALLASPLRDKYLALRKALIANAREITEFAVPVSLQKEATEVLEAYKNSALDSIRATNEHYLFNTGNYYVNVAGEVRHVSVAGWPANNPYNTRNHLRMLNSVCEKDLPLNSDLITPCGSYNTTNLTVLPTKGKHAHLASTLTKLLGEWDDLMGELEEFISLVQEQIKPFTTSNQLLIAWPEASELLPPEPVKQNKSLSVPVSTLNKKVGLPKKAKK